MPEYISSVVSNLSNQQANHPYQFNHHQHNFDNLDPNKNERNSLDVNQNQYENKPLFARVNPSRNSIIKNENCLWSNPVMRQNNNSIYTITLVNGVHAPGPLGIHVIPNLESTIQMNMGLIIQRIEHGSRVDRDGRLQTGDCIIEINKKNLIGLDFLKCQEILREAIAQSNQNGVLELKITRTNNPNTETNFENENIKEIQSESKNEPLDELSTKESQIFKPTSINLGVLNTKKIGTKITIQLTKGPEGLGFKLSARDNFTPGEFSPIYIKNILPIGAAVTDGRLQRGDRILEVNKIDVTQKTLHEAVEILRNINLGDKVDIVVSRQIVEEPDSVSANSDTIKEIQSKLDDNKKNFNPKRQKITIKIQLNSETKSLGIHVQCKNKRLEESENLVDLGIYVKTIIPDGAAYIDGRLKENDQIINLNGVSLLGKSNDEAMCLLKEAMKFEKNSEFIEITVSRKDPKQSKREQSESPAKQSIKLSHVNRKSGEYVENEQFSKFDRDAPSRRSVSEKRTKMCTVPNNYATNRRQRNQSLNDQNAKRSQVNLNSNPKPVYNQMTQTLGRLPKKQHLNTNLTSHYPVESNQKSTSMELIPSNHYNLQILNKKIPHNENQNKFQTIGTIRNDKNNRQSVHLENYVHYNNDLDCSTLNRLKFTNRSFVTAVNKSIDKYTSNDSTIEEKSEINEKSTTNKSEMSNPDKKPIDSSTKQKSLIGKFQNLFKSSHNGKKSDKNKNSCKLHPQDYNKEDLKTTFNKTNSKNNLKKDSEFLQSKNNNQNEVMIENNTLYTQYKPDINMNLSEIKKPFHLNQTNREPVYQSIDSQQYLIEQQRILIEKQKKIFEKQQRYNTHQEDDRQSRIVTRKSSIYQPHILESYEKIKFSEPFTASTQKNLVSDLIKESDFFHKYYNETSSTTSSIISSSSLYTTSSMASEHQNQPIHHQVEFSTQV